MPAKPKPKPDDPEQFARFKEAVKALGVDESSEAFERAFEKVVPEKAKPEPKN